MGRPYNLAGKVVPGKRRGTELGFPTANIDSDKEPLPPRGVYAVRVLFAGRRLDGVLNIGFNPTFDGEKQTIEVHIFDFHEDIYGKDPGYPVH